MKKLIIFLILILFLILNSVNAIEPNQTKDSDEPGPYNVGYYKVYYKNPNYGTYLATIRYPAKYDGLLAPIDDSNSPYPGIVVSNGWAGSEWNIKWIPKHLSSYGYITICFTPPNQFIGNTTQWAIGFKDGIEK